jgi:PIN domain nuclease of toxin-antitoxin system
LRYLLDTCTFLWLCCTPDRLSTRAREDLDDARAELLLGDVSILEVSMKWTSGKITLSAPPRSWIEQQAAIWHFTRVPISRPAIYRSTELPNVHRDPFDRLLVACALEEDATIVTPDEWIHRYPVPWVW